MRRELFFLSHAARNADKAAVVSEAVRAATGDGMAVFSTSERILPSGGNWRDEVVRAIAYTGGVILIATVEAFESIEVAFEVGVAAALAKPLHVVQDGSIAHRDLPLGLQQREVLDLSIARDWERLLEALAKDADYLGDVDVENRANWAERFAPPADLAIAVAGNSVMLQNLTDFEVLVTSVSTASGGHWAEYFTAKRLAPRSDLYAFRRSLEDDALTVHYEKGRRHFASVLEVPAA